MADTCPTDAWMSEGFFLGGTSRGFSQDFFQRAKNGENWFLSLEIEKTSFFC